MTTQNTAERLSQIGIAPALPDAPRSKIGATRSVPLKKVIKRDGEFILDDEGNKTYEDIIWQTKLSGKRPAAIIYQENTDMIRKIDSRIKSDKGAVASGQAYLNDYLHILIDAGVEQKRTAKRVEKPA